MPQRAETRPTLFHRSFVVVSVRTSLVREASLMSIEARRGPGYTVNSVCLDGARDSRANSVSFLCPLTTRLRLDDAVADRVAHELAHRMEIELRHNLRS